MKFQNIESLPGSPEPGDIFEPHMPGVDLLSDMDGFFTQVRELLEVKNINEYIQNADLRLLDHPDKSGKEIPEGLRHVAVVTPGRIICCGLFLRSDFEVQRLPACSGQFWNRTTSVRTRLLARWWA